MFIGHRKLKHLKKIGHRIGHHALVGARKALHTAGKASHVVSLGAGYLGRPDIGAGALAGGALADSLAKRANRIEKIRREYE